MLQAELGADWEMPLVKPFIRVIKGDARSIPLPNSSVDLVVTSPPYWRKRDYGLRNQIGQEPSPEQYADALGDAFEEWRRILRPTGSVFLNIGDTYWNRRLAGIPGMIEERARQDRWVLRNRIVWTKTGGMPDPAKDRLANRHEFILHLAKDRAYYYDLAGYADAYGSGPNPGDVWRIGLQRNLGNHLAPFPEEIVQRAITLACPTAVCSKCGAPRRRIVRRTTELDLARPQARRALEIVQKAGLTKEHLTAVQATGISDAGKALKIQNGTGRNAEHVKQLAAEAKRALGGYFREFTFARRKTVGWTHCNCEQEFMPGVVIDPFMGSGTTLRVATRMGRSAIGVDLAANGADMDGE